jgi:IS5 family transposase
MPTIRSPLERVSSKDNKRLRYVGLVENQFAEFMNSICFNLMRLVIITA